MKRPCFCNLHILILLAFVMNLFACGGGGGGTAATSSPTPPMVTIPSISYSGSIVATVNLVIAAAVPINSGSAATSCASSPSLPTGLNLSSDCMISGTPSIVASTVIYTITASNSAGNGSATISITVNLSGLTVSSVSPNHGIKTGGTPVTITGAGFISGATVAIGGTNCGSVNVSSTTQMTCVTGAAGSAATVDVIVSVSGQNGSLVNAFAFYNAPAISPTTKTLAVNNSFTFSASGGYGSYTYNVVTGGGGSFSGAIYTGPASTGTYSVKVTDGDGNQSAATVTINAALAISPSSKTLAVNNTFTFSASGGVSPYTYATTNGSINSATGAFTAPVSSGSATVTITDFLGNTSNSTVTINPVLNVSPTAATVTIGNTQVFTASGGTPPYTFTVVGSNGTITTITSTTATFSSTNGLNETARITDSSSSIADGIITGRRPTEISAAKAGSHSCAVFSDGSIQCWGNNSVGQLGNGTTINSITPVSVSGITTATMVATGVAHSCARLSDGTAKCWGGNYLGALGNNATTASTTPVTVNGSGYSIIGLGANNSCALTSSGVVKCWGDNVSYALGRYVYEQTSNIAHITQKIPYDVSYAPAVFSLMGAGAYGSCAVTAAGSVYCWGDNYWGTLGQSCGISTNLIANPVTGLTNVNGVSVGDGHACASKTNGAVVCWGANFIGQLGNSSGTACQNGSAPVTVPGISTASIVTAANSHSCARLSDGTAKCWGSNGFGELGNNTTVASTAPVSVSGLSNVSKISGGASHTCALDSNSRIWCWGWNNVGQLGDNSTTTRLIPVQVGPWK